MKPLEVYRRLPKKNCGQCPQLTCMAFALGLLRGEAAVEDCPLLDDVQKRELGEIRREDWRNTLIETLKSEVKAIDFNEKYRHIGAEYRDGHLILTCLGVEYSIGPDGDVQTEGYINPWITILLLHYIRFGGGGALSGRWVSFSELKSGLFKAPTFKRDCEEPLGELLDRDFERTETLMRRLGARRISSESCPHAWQVNALPKVPLLVLYWPGDAAEESPVRSRVTVLFDSSVDRFLDVESLFFLLEGFIHVLSRA